jgi:hypothetical protein
MPWYILLIAVYAAGFVEFWRLCVEAPLADESAA